MSTGEGPAFFGTMLYFGMSQILLDGSLLARVLALAVAQRVAVAARSRMVASMLLAFCIPFALVMAGYAGGFVGKNLVIGVSLLASPLVWLACSIALMHGNSFKATPQGSAALFTG